MEQIGVAPRVGAAVGSGLIGGVVFGVVLLAFGSDPAGVAWVLGGNGAGAGWGALLLIGVVLGIVYAFTFGNLRHTWATGAGYGLAHGAIWWLLLVVIAMPLILGYPIGAFTVTTFANLVGYLALGVIVGLTHAWLFEQQADPTASATAAGGSASAART